MRATITVMWHVRLRMRVARPRARGRKRRSVGPSSAKQADDEQLVGVLLVVVHGVGDGAGEHLADVGGDAALGELQHLVGAPDVEAADQVEHLAGLAGATSARTWRCALVPVRSPTTVAPSLSLGPVISGDPSRSSPGRRGT